MEAVQIDPRSAYYRINDQTLYIRSAKTTYAVSEIEELDGTHYTMQKGYKIIEHACLRNGSSYQGRAQAMKELFNLKQNPPIPIDPNRDLYVFPTQAPKNEDCIWVITKNIKEIEERDRSSIIYYKNGKVLRVHLSKFRMEKLCAHLYKYHLYFRQP
ncbi:competence protein ComK [Amphibacillus sp. MSJ-3]|uniref:competence protein ComK n=1 Tax=Amphibacillus sp. MSJ-3 TaxID=2841505 RepID=UPI001C0EF6E4|nr:competence protein ComK [Amphibacillus sp. MSJ-3]MBU5594505.1 competence protein ComK [Amphibacillus sp. MSJ-3]